MHKLLKILSKETVWLILDELSSRNLTPTDLSKKLDMSVANVDKFMDLLEEAGIVVKNKKIRKGPGRPFTEYALAKGQVFIVDFGSGKKTILPYNEKLSEDVNSLIKKYRGENI